MVICLQSLTVFWIDGENYFSQALIVHGVNNVKQTKICTAEPLVPKVKIAIKNLEMYK